MPPAGASNRLNPQMPASVGAPSSPGVLNQNPRSPTLGHQQSNSMNPYGNTPGGASFRPSNLQSGSIRVPPGQMPGQVNRGQSAHGFGMHPNQQHAGSNYPGMPYGGPQGYYAYGYYGPDSPYGPGPGPVQWQTGQGSTPLSPRAGNATPHNASGAQHSSSAPNVNGAGGQSISTTNRPSASHNPSNFSSSSQTSGPSTPSQSHARPASFQPGQPFSPGHMSSPSANLHASANAFVPRTKSSAIKITRADGTAVDLATAAKELKTPNPTGGPSASASATPGTPVPASTKPKLPAMPVVVRMETEAQKAKRLSDQEEAKVRKASDEKEEAERRERETARREKEEREAAEAKEREEADVKQKVRRNISRFWHEIYEADFISRCRRKKRSE
jgi:translation initiation factor 4G